MWEKISKYYSSWLEFSASLLLVGMTLTPKTRP